jgi:hypothetical protein
VSPAVDVIVDRHDDIATVRAIRELAAREPGVLAVSIAPGSQAEPAVVWAILRALGKRIEQLDRTKIKVHNARRLRRTTTPPTVSARSMRALAAGAEIASVAVSLRLPATPDA